MSLILGIDPGSLITGYGLIKKTDKNIQYVTCGCIRIKSKEIAGRLTEIFDGISELMREYRPKLMAIESVFMHKNAQSALKLGQARGAAIVAASTHCAEVFEYSARQIKQAVVGYGNAEKVQVQDMVRRLLQLNKVPQNDAADGLAIAICHAQMTNNKVLAQLALNKKHKGRLI